MREIKFRAWNPKHKKMYICDWQTLVSSIGRDDLSDGQEPAWQLETDANGSNEIMQYTGLKDKNGKEIYEGDIVMNAKNEWDKEKYIVEYSDVGISPFYQTDNDGCPYNLTYEKCAVIGNIYENEDLIK